MTSTRETLLSLIDDVELITKELLENSVAPKTQKLSSNEHSQLTELLIQKDADLKAAMKLAEEQAEIHQKMELLQAEVDKQDHNIRQLQKHLKDAEQILATAIYQAKQKLQMIDRANTNSVQSEELIKFAHRISASNAVCAPLTWQQGDPRRPYPTDIEMRKGFLGRRDLSINGSLLQSQSILPDTLHKHGPHIHTEQPAQISNFSWHLSGDNYKSELHGSVIDTKSHKDEDVEVMSTDSSSSSSSDSQ